MTLKTNDTTTPQDESIAIMELGQNTVQLLSVMVYLDGERMTNADVAADAAKSMVGTMNLQFSSSANLVPMEYSDLRSENGGEVGVTTITNVIVPEGYRASSVYKSGNQLAFTLTGVTEGQTVNVIVNGQTYTAEAGTYMGMSGYAVILSGDEEVTAVEITVTGGTSAEPTPEEP